MKADTAHKAETGITRRRLTARYHVEKIIPAQIESVIRSGHIFASVVQLPQSSVVVIRGDPRQLHDRSRIRTLREAGENQFPIRHLVHEIAEAAEVPGYLRVGHGIR